LEIRPHIRAALAAGRADKASMKALTEPLNHLPQVGHIFLDHPAISSKRDSSGFGAFLSGCDFSGGFMA
jgi:hypothetical protein